MGWLLLLIYLHAVPGCGILQGESVVLRYRVACFPRVMVLGKHSLDLELLKALLQYVSLILRSLNWKTKFFIFCNNIWNLSTISTKKDLLFLECIFSSPNNTYQETSLLQFFPLIFLLWCSRWKSGWMNSVKSLVSVYILTWKRISVLHIHWPYMQVHSRLFDLLMRH